MSLPIESREVYERLVHEAEAQIAAHEAIMAYID